MTWLHAAPNPNGILTSPLLGLVLPSMDGAASGSHAQHNVRASLSTESRGHAHTHSYAKSKISGLFYYLVRKSKITYQECHLGHVAQENREDQEFLEHSCNQYTRELHHLKQKSFISCSTPVMPKLNVLHTLLQRMANTFWPESNRIIALILLEDQFQHITKLPVVRQRIRTYYS